MKIIKISILVFVKRGILLNNIVKIAINLTLVFALFIIKIQSCSAVYRNYTDWTEVPNSKIFLVDKPREQKRTIFNLNVVECTEKTRVSIFIAENSSGDGERCIGHFYVESNCEYFINCELGANNYIKLSLDTLANFEVDMNRAMPEALGEKQKKIFIST
jgi:hypothetical protein